MKPSTIVSKMLTHRVKVGLFPEVLKSLLVTTGKEMKISHFCGILFTSYKLTAHGATSTEGCDACVHTIQHC